MGKASNIAARMLIRVMAVLVAGILISAAFLFNIDTYSWLMGSASGSAKVSAATTEDILQSIEFVPAEKVRWPKNWVGPYLRIKRASGLKYAPLIHFSVNGEAADYILHINPVRLDSEGYYIIPIDTDVNVTQHVDLCRAKPESITGTITIKYMNEFIDEDIQIELDRKYLRSRLVEYIIRESSHEEAEVENVQIYSMRAATSIELPNALGLEEQSVSDDSVIIEAIKYLASLVTWEGIGAASEEVKAPDEALGLRLSADQETLINIIYPGLKDYVEGLNSLVVELKLNLQAKEAQLADLDAKLASLEVQYGQLLEENAKLVEQINSMTLIQVPVVPATGTIAPPITTGGTSGTPVIQAPGGTPGTTPGTETPGSTPGTTPGTETPGGTPGMTPGTETPGSTPGTTPGTETPGSIPGTTPGTETPGGDTGSNTGVQNPSGDNSNNSGNNTPAPTDGDSTNPSQPEGGNDGGTPDNQQGPGSQDAIVGGSEEEDGSAGPSETGSTPDGETGGTGSGDGTGSSASQTGE